MAMRSLNGWMCAMIVVIGLAACSGPTATVETGPPDSTSPPATEEPATAGAAAEASTPTPLPTPTPEPTATSIPPTSTPTPEPEPTETPGPTPLPYDYQTLETIAKLNHWRLVEGLWPLRINDTLSEAAADQADYLLSLSSWPDDVHVGREGEGIHERVTRRFGWPYYNNDQQVAAGEITYVGANLDAALAFWVSSPIHNATATSEGYREIGVAVRDHPWGHLYVVVFGSRPNVLTALYEPLSGLVYLSSERYRWAPGGDWILDVLDVGIREADETETDPNHEFPWQLYLRAPEDDASRFSVAYSDGVHQVVVDVDRGVDVAWYPDNLPTETAEGATAGAETPTPAEGEAETGDEAAGEATEEPTAESTSTPEPATAAGALRIGYDAHSLYILNTSDAPVDLTGLTIEGGGMSLPATRWETQWLTAPLSAFPGSDCLVVHAWDQADPGQPPGCRYRRAVILVPGTDTFWGEGDFDIQWNGETIAQCEAGGETCEVTLP
jgi:uncharacterized protein YkwD